MVYKIKMNNILENINNLPVQEIIFNLNPIQVIKDYLQSMEEETHLIIIFIWVNNVITLDNHLQILTKDTLHNQISLEEDHLVPETLIWCLEDRIFQVLEGFMVQEDLILVLVDLVDLGRINNILCNNRMVDFIIQICRIHINNKCLANNNKKKKRKRDKRKRRRKEE